MARPLFESFEAVPRWRPRRLHRITLSIAILSLLAAAQSPLPLVPDDALSPGATNTGNMDQVCAPNYSRQIRQVSVSMRRAVYAEYGLTAASCGHCEIDHRIPLEIGGSNEKSNLWPQSDDTKPWNAHSKDRLEDYIHERVCKGDMPLAEAQQLFRGNWIDAYEKVFHVDAPKN